ncbi:hypothetical protein RDV89_05405 [Nocardioides zeae]|uniref:Peptidase MA-like domain-containing protein n=1 Tax=Nocardioides imazamoxiresistens TaxID=3231893 RepID=A0ABU3PTE4_9ACTN|nr:hypothetical protein [Nocardioides zeae]MDT9592493.1 hypothetical protein [Nocardioides zeae]
MLGLLLVALLAARCGLPGDQRDGAGGDRASEAARAAEPLVADVLDRRARALQAGDATAWAAEVAATADPAYVERQAWVFTNLLQLPRRVATWDVVAGSARDEGGRVAVDVRRSLQVDGWDSAPVVTVARHTFVREDGAYRLVGDAEDAAPWDRGPVQVLREGGALVVADAGDGRAAGLPGEVADAVAAVDGLVPFAWSATAMVYALGSPEALDRAAGVDDPSALDGVAFPVWTDPDGGGDVAALRVVLSPRVLDGSLGPGTRDRLLRHELTHVALGSRDDRVPVWLSEGVAEYVAVRGLPRSERVISRGALDAAVRGDAALPADDDFRGAVSGTSYGLAWYACEHVAAVYGAETLWQLLDSYAASPDEERDGVLTRTLGIDGAELADAAAERIVATFG